MTSSTFSSFGKHILMAKITRKKKKGNYRSEHSDCGKDRQKLDLYTKSVILSFNNHWLDVAECLQQVMLIAFWRHTKNRGVSFSTVEFQSFHALRWYIFEDTSMPLAFGFACLRCSKSIFWTKSWKYPWYRKARVFPGFYHPASTFCNLFNTSHLKTQLAFFVFKFTFWVGKWDSLHMLQNSWPGFLISEILICHLKQQNQSTKNKQTNKNPR